MFLSKIIEEESWTPATLPIFIQLIFKMLCCLFHLTFQVTY